MMTWLIKNRIAAFERQFGYDASYLRELLAIDARAFWAFAKVQKMKYRKDVPRDVYYAASITAAMAEDCGPCTQLVVGMAIGEGSTHAVIANIVAGDVVALPEEVALAVNFTRAVLAHSIEADDLRADIERRWGKRAVASLALAVASARVYPTVKYALGFGKACTRVTVGDKQVVPRRGMVAA
jgi:hypothetical protein